MKNNKKTTKRSKAKYPALIPGLNSRIRQEYNDYDYLDQLNEEEKTWLNKFTEEYTNASFKNDGTDLHKTDAERKDSYDRNNARNRCLYGRIKLNNAADKVSDYEDVVHALEESQTINNVEDSYLEYMEFKELKEYISEYEKFMKQFNEESE